MDEYWAVLGIGIGTLGSVKRDPWMEFEFQDLSETIGMVL